jgi:hypothetical protein
MLEKELERRRKRYEFALVYWNESDSGFYGNYYAIESKKDLEGWIEGEEYTLLCDTEPRRLLYAMKKLLKES